MLTNEQVLAEFNKAQERLKPAKLADTPANGLAVSVYMHSHNLIPATEDNFLIAIKALFQTLEWVVKPAKLVLLEKNDAPAPVDNPRLLEEKRTNALKAAEAATVKSKADEASIRQAQLLIENYRPTKLAMGTSRIDNLEISTMAPKWTTALNKAIANKQDLQQFVVALSAAIQNRWRERERASERMR